MLKRLTGLITVTLLSAASATLAADSTGFVVVTSSNTSENQLLVYDTAGTLMQTVPTLGRGGAGGNAGGIATGNGHVAVVNFASQTVSLFSRGGAGFELRQNIPTSSAPVSVAFGKTHLYVLGTTTVESHRIGGDGVEAGADGIAALLAGDGSAAQVGLLADRLIVTEKSGTVETIPLQAGAVAGSPERVILPAGSSDTPFGFVTRGSHAYLTIAGADLVGVVKDDGPTTFAATGTPGGGGQHSPCWIALVGPYLFTTNTPSHSISRLIAAGRNILLDEPVAAQTDGGATDIAAEGELLAVIESDRSGVSHLTQFRIDEDGNLARTARTSIASAANGVAIITGK